MVFTLAVSVAFGKKQGIATVNEFDEKSLEKAVRRAEGPEELAVAGAVHHRRPDDGPFAAAGANDLLRRQLGAFLRREHEPDIAVPAATPEHLFTAGLDRAPKPVPARP